MDHTTFFAECRELDVELQCQNERALDELFLGLLPEQTMLWNEMEQGFSMPVVVAKTEAEPVLPMVAEPDANFGFRVSNMTVEFQLSQPIALPLLARFVRSDVSVIFDPMRKALDCTRRRKVEGAKIKTFKNQIELGFRIGCRRATCQVFQNGTVHLLGVRSSHEVELFMNRIVSAVQNCFDPNTRETAVPMPGALHVLHCFKIILNRGDGHLSSRVRLQQLAGHLQRRREVKHVSYDPDQYCAVKVVVEEPMLKKDITVAVFSTGAIQVTAAVAEGYLKKGEKWGI